MYVRGNRFYLSFVVVKPEISKQNKNEESQIRAWYTW